MARQVFVLEEISAILLATGAPKRVIEAFESRAKTIIEMRPEKGVQTVSADEEVDDITVASGFGSKSRVGFVELTLNNLRTQMESKKAREVGLMLIEAAEAASSDEIFVKLLEKLGVTNSQAHGEILVDLREIRQGTRGISYPH
jgi:voltage-gated potassium channel Kch